MSALDKKKSDQALNKSIPYDERSSVFVSMGDRYGSGKPNPVGHRDGAKLNVESLPSGCLEKNV